MTLRLNWPRTEKTLMFKPSLPEQERSTDGPRNTLPTLPLNKLVLLLSNLQTSRKKHQVTMVLKR